VTTPIAAPRTGPDHYRQAQNLLRRAGYDTAERAHVAEPTEGRLAWLAAAQVHATLALAAATALNDSQAGMRLVDHNAWYDAIGVPIPEPTGYCDGCSQTYPRSQLVNINEPDSWAEPRYRCLPCRTRVAAPADR
jgi:hypothetical protein